MQQNRRVGVFREALGYEGLAMLVCLLLGLAMVVNTQLGGEAMWYWYATVFHHGAKLYSGLHTPLQPLFLLLTDAWMTLFGRRFIVTEVPSVIQILGLSFGMFLILRESSWPSWQKAIVLVAAFVLTVGGHSYRFDDYHVMAEQFVIYALVLLLWMARSEDERRVLLLSAGLGLICGLTITTRVTDGVALLAAVAICIPFLRLARRVASVAVVLMVAALTVLFVVHLTGDTFSAYISSTVFRAAASKGGTGSIFAAPFLIVRNTLVELVHVRKRLLFEIVLVLGVCPVVYLNFRRGVRYMVPVQAVLVVLICLSSKVQLHDFATGTMIDVVVLAATTVMYVVAAIIAARLLVAVAGGDNSGREWPRREVLIFVPLALWASNSAASAGDPLVNYYAPVGALVLLVTVWGPFGRQAEWANPVLVTLLALMAMSGISAKIITPYAWQNDNTYPMFEHRQWYHHPVYGEMYIDRGLLKLSVSVCNEIGSVPGKNAPELLSIPYPFPNLFCDTPPWHNYVQTFFDTSTRGTIEQLMGELNTAPPKYIVYQQQLGILRGAERLYNRGKPLAQRDLDTMIMRKLATGQWKLLEKSDYLAPSRPEAWYDPQQNGWYIIQTHP